MNRLLRDYTVALKFDGVRVERTESGAICVSLEQAGARLVSLGPFYLNPHDVITLPLRGEMDFELSTT